MEEDIKVLEEILNRQIEDTEGTKRMKQAIENLIKGYKEHRNALIDMVNQFADTDKEEKHLSTMGLSALENAFTVLNIDEGIEREELWKLVEEENK